MAHADRDARARSDRACARCHTTWGFLETIERSPGERDRRVDRSPPAHAGQVGITCAACHAVHDSRHGRPGGRAAAHAARAAPAGERGRRRDRGGRAQRRLPPLPHARRDGGRPARHGRGADVRARRPGPAERPPADRHAGARVRHRRLRRLPPRRPRRRRRGAGHAFQPAPAVCAPCHPTPLPASDLPQQARRLWDRWRGDAETAAFPHATGASARPRDAGRARAVERAAGARGSSGGGAQRPLRAGAAGRLRTRAVRAEHAMTSARAAWPLLAAGDAPRAARPGRSAAAASSRPCASPSASRPDRSGVRRPPRRLLQPAGRRPRRPAVLVPRQHRRLRRLREPEGQGRPRPRPPGLRPGRIHGAAPGRSCASRFASRPATCR